MIRKLVAFGAVIIGFTVAYGYNEEPKQQQQSATLRCKLFSVDTDAGLMVVSKGQLGSGNSGGGEDKNKTVPTNPYIVKVTKETVIHWNGQRERISLNDLRAMNINQLNTPLAIRYDKSNDTDGQTPKKFTATEVIIFKPGDVQDNQAKP